VKDGLPVTFYSNLEIYSQESYLTQLNEILNTFHNSEKSDSNHSEASANEMCKDSEITEEMKELSTNGHLKQTKNSDELPTDTSSKNGLADNYDKMGQNGELKDSSSLNNGEVAQNGFAHESISQECDDNRSDTDAMDQDKGI
jgi:hypothetical protein